MKKNPGTIERYQDFFRLKYLINSTLLYQGNLL